MKKTPENLESLVMNVEEALTLLNGLILNKTGKPLTVLQVAAFRGAWLNRTYKEVGKEHESTESSIANAGSLLWEQLSSATGQKVTKKNFKKILESLVQNPLFLSVSKSPDLNEQLITIDNIQPSTTTRNSLNNISKKFFGQPNKAPTAPEGPIELDSNFYIERPPIEIECWQKVQQEGALIRIKAPRQMGKTSLLLRVLALSQKEGYGIVSLNLRYIDREKLSNIDRLLKWLCVACGRALKLPDRIDDYWDEVYGSNGSCDDYFKNYLLAQIERPLVLALDNVDTVFSIPHVAEDFLALLRAWHEEAKSDRQIKNLRLVISHSTEVYIPLKINQSPFNVGYSIELPEFLPSQVLELASKYGLSWSAGQLEQIMAMIGGHPYLVQLGLQHLTKKNLELEKFLRLAPTDSGPYGDHLRRYLILLHEQPELASALQAVLSNASVHLDTMEMFKLRAVGLIDLNEDDEAFIRCELYRRYLSERLTVGM